MDQPRVSLNDLRQIIQLEVERLTPAKPPVVEYVEKDPKLKPESPGNGASCSFPSDFYSVLNS